MRTVTLNNGVEMPLIGLGTYQVVGEDLVETFRVAYDCGYRAFDTAIVYENESDLCKAIKQFGIKREDLFITSKIHPREFTDATNIRETIIGSIKRLGFDYIDLYLVHYPDCRYVLSIWKELSKLYKDGYIRAIGVSNFLEKHLIWLEENSDIIPVINQIERHPYNSRLKMLDFCQKHDICVEAYSPFAWGNATSGLMDNVVIKDIASKYNKSSAQIILRWDVQQGVVAIPKSHNAIRLAEDINIFDFELTEHEINSINKLNINKFFGADPNVTPKYMIKQGVLSNELQFNKF